METLSKKIITLDGHPIHIDITFLILVGFFVFPSFGDSISEHFVALMMFPILTISIIVHELGHAWMAQRLGLGRSKILLWGVGGLCFTRGNKKDRSGLKISLAGPAAELLFLGLPALAIWLLFFQGQPTNGESMWVMRSLVWFTLWVNLGWALLNLLPLLPLDGGQSLVYGLRLWRNKSKDESVRLAGTVGLALSPILAIFCLLSNQYFTLLLLFFIAQLCYNARTKGHSAFRI